MLCAQGVWIEGGGGRGWAGGRALQRGTTINTSQIETACNNSIAPHTAAMLTRISNAIKNNPTTHYISLSPSAEKEICEELVRPWPCTVSLKTLFGRMTVRLTGPSSVAFVLSDANLNILHQGLHQPPVRWTSQ